MFVQLLTLDPAVITATAALVSAFALFLKYGKTFATTRAYHFSFVFLIICGLVVWLIWFIAGAAAVGNSARPVAPLPRRSVAHHSHPSKRHHQCEARLDQPQHAAKPGARKTSPVCGKPAI